MTIFIVYCKEDLFNCQLCEREGVIHKILDAELEEKITNNVKEESIKRLVDSGYMSRYDAMRMVGILIDDTGEDGINVIKSTIQKLKDEVEKT